MMSGISSVAPIRAGSRGRAICHASPAVILYPSTLRPMTTVSRPVSTVSTMNPSTAVRTRTGTKTSVKRSSSRVAWAFVSVCPGVGMFTDPR